MLKRLALGLSLGSVLIVGAAFAQTQKPTHGGTPEEQKACAHDVARHCKAVMNGDDLTVLGCLQQNRPKLAPACLKVLESHGV
jgi:hypothetical protein